MAGPGATTQSSGGTNGDRRRARALLDNEQFITERLDGKPLDFLSMLAVSNVYRAAGAVRRRAERELLNDLGLSWGGFTIVWVLWIWGSMETGRLAAECDLAKGTLTGMLNTLQRRGLVEKERMANDRRRVEVSLTDEGLRLIEDLFPKFNGFEAAMTEGLSEQDKVRLADLLRIVILNAEPQGEGAN